MTEVTVVETDLDGDGVTDVVEVTTVTGVDVDGDGEPDIVEVSTISAIDVDGDGVRRRDRDDDGHRGRRRR